LEYLIDKYTLERTLIRIQLQEIRKEVNEIETKLLNRSRRLVSTI
jgi:hypothetical protein